MQNNTANIRELRSFVEQQRGKRDQIADDIDRLRNRIDTNKQNLVNHEEAREVIRTVGMKTQQQLQYHISDITSLALDAVYDDPYELVAEFVMRRNKSECDLYFMRNDNRIDPRTAAGGGAVDVAAFALRVASWSMQRPKSRNLLMLDEPFVRLKGEKANLRSLKLLKTISDRLKLQMLVVADERVSIDDLLENTDKVFRVTLHKGVSKVEEEK